MNITCFRKIAWTISWDAGNKRHRYLRNADLVIEGEKIVYLGSHYKGAVNDNIDGSRYLVMPGLVCLHSHISTDLLGKGCMEESGSLFSCDPVAGVMHDLYPKMDVEAKDRKVILEFAVADLLQSGCTTVVDMSSSYYDWVENLEATGIRGYVGASYSSGKYYTPNGHEMGFEWDFAQGRQQFAKALETVDHAEKYGHGLVKGMLVPAQCDSCSEELFRDSVHAAKQRNIPIQTHASQTIHEFGTMVSRHGKTPVEFLAEVGFLGPMATIGHGIFIDQHPWINFSRHVDLDLLVSTCTTVAHCPTTQTRRAKMLRSFGGYMRAGVNMAIGVDIFPHNMIDEIRCATVMGKVADRRMTALTASDVFYAATVGGANALGRDDLGRIDVGCKADIVLVDLDHPSMQPLYDPLRSLVFSGLERPVRDVYVNGKRVVADGVAVAINQAELIHRVRKAQKAMFDRIPTLDWAGRTIIELLPPSMPITEYGSSTS